MSGINVVRSADAPDYEPPGHVDVDAVRLQGLESGGPTGMWVGRSLYAPGGRAELAPTAGDTVYVVLSGSLMLSVTGDAATRLEPGDSVFLPGGTERSVINETEAEATLLVVMRPASDD